MACGDRIDADAVPARLLRGEEDRTQPPESDVSLAEQIRRYERGVIAKRLAQYGAGSRAKDAVAKELGISRATLYRRLSELEIT
ncbi:MAG: helix-turn-helix domain-containing protein [Clostridiales Family XIII bacterium]|nr:helix-turn-helix domain-containing protein [Clostridiales Family XIII bacterium]